MLTESLNKNHTFSELFYRALHAKSNSCPPKFEMTGTLVPNSEKTDHSYKFRLETSSSDYLLKMNKHLERTAEKMKWSDVIVKGYIASYEIIEVEQIIPITKSTQTRFAQFYKEPFDELDTIRHTIDHDGKIEPAIEEIAI